MNRCVPLMASSQFREYKMMGNKFSHVADKPADNDEDTDQLKNKRRDRILVVEDHVIIRKLHALFLKQMRFNFDLVTTGYEALNYDYKNCTLVLLDIGLPDIDGITVCSTLRATYSKKELPIIALTAHGQGIEQECFEAGMNEVLQKPIEFDHLKSILNYWLKIT